MAAIISKTPPINATGAYVLKLPFVAAPGKSYRCEAIDGFNALQARNIDIYQSYYAPKGLTQDVMAADKGVDVNIVTLFGEDAEIIYVPSSYILSYPNELSVPYGRIIICVDLGALPSDFYTENIRANLQNIGSSETGNPAIATTHVMPLSNYISPDAHDLLNQNRINAIKDVISVYGGKVLNDEEMSKTNEKVNALEGIMKDNFGIGS